MVHTRRKWKALLAVGVAAAAVFFCTRPEALLPAEPPIPDFAAYRDARERKAAFFDYLRPLVEGVNAEIVQERERLLRVRETVLALETRTSTNGSTPWSGTIALARRFRRPRFTPKKISR